MTIRIRVRGKILVTWVRNYNEREESWTGNNRCTEDIPFGTGLFVPGYGCGTVQDRGGAIKGMHIDAWFSTEKQALNWGRKRNVPVEVCDDPH
jgi:3D (Asp-Asp-Asp) domain-containing protein